MMSECGDGKHIAWFDADRCRCGAVGIMKADHAIAAPVEASAAGSHVHRSEDGNATAAADAEAILRVAEIIIEGKDRLIAAFREYAEMEAKIDNGEASPELTDRARRIRDGLLIGTQK